MKPLCDQLAEETKHPVDRSYSSSSSQAAVTPQQKLPGDLLSVFVLSMSDIEVGQKAYLKFCRKA